MSKRKSDRKAKLRATRATTLKKEQEMEDTTFTRQANETYELLDEQFLIRDAKTIQYASAYFIRLEELRPLLEEASASKWKNCSIEKEIVNVKSKNTEWVIVGTLFKEMKLKPTINLEIVAILGKKAESYVDEEDIMLIEDHSGRMKLCKNDILHPSEFVTGTVIALKGKIDTNGLFEVSDYTFPGIPSIESMPEKYNNITEENKNTDPLFENLRNREFIAFVSGIEFGNSREKATTELFTRWLLGQYGTTNDRLLSSRISRLIIGGNNIGEESDIDEVIKGSYRTQEINERVYSNLSDTMEQFESFLFNLAKHLDVDVMPGDNDISGSFLPQQPANVALFPKLLKNDNILFWTNPHKFSVNGLLWLGTSGQNIEDICRFKSMEGKKQIDILFETLQMRHLAPTCPDTLRSYPFESEDPLVIKEAPNIYFSCNAKEYESKLDTQMNGAIRYFTVPSFTHQKELVLLDLESLETYCYKLDLVENE